MSSKLVSELMAILRQQQGISGIITEDSKICSDLGVCDEDFQDYMEEVWRVYGLPKDETVRLDKTENQITLADIARWVEEAR